jgi:hypothetical protein
LGNQLLRIQAVGAMNIFSMQWLIFALPNTGKGEMKTMSTNGIPIHK